MGGLIQDIKLKGADLPKLEALREKGRNSFLRQGLPTPKTEAWKYTRVRTLTGDDFVIEETTASKCSCKQNKTCCCNDQSFPLPLDAYEIRFCNGKLQNDHFHLPDGVDIYPLVEAFDDPDIFHLLNKSFDMEKFPFAALNTAYLEQGIFLCIGQNIVLDKPIAFLYHSSGEVKRFTNIRNLIVLEAGAQAEMIEYYNYSGTPKSEYFNNIVHEIYIGRNAKLRHYAVQNEAFKAVHIALTAVKVKENGNFESFCLQKGADLARRETHVILQETGAETNVNAVYMMSGWATLDTTTDVEHQAPHTRSGQLIKGVVNGQAKGVFQGKIHIVSGAQQTEGNQLHRALLLSNNAEVDVKPELEIFADDVKCSHGAACGELDAEQLFYLRSRGIGEEEARQMLIEAFVDEAFQTIKNPSIREWVQSI